MDLYLLLGQDLHRVNEAIQVVIEGLLITGSMNKGNRLSFEAVKLYFTFGPIFQN